MKESRLDRAVTRAFLFQIGLSRPDPSREPANSGGYGDFCFVVQNRTFHLRYQGKVEYGPTSAPRRSSVLRFHLAVRVRSPGLVHRWEDLQRGPRAVGAVCTENARFVQENATFGSATNKMYGVSMSMLSLIATIVSILLSVVAIVVTVRIGRATEKILDTIQYGVERTQQGVTSLHEMVVALAPKRVPTVAEASMPPDTLERTRAIIEKELESRLEVPAYKIVSELLYGMSLEDALNALFHLGQKGVIVLPEYVKAPADIGQATTITRRKRKA